MRNYSAREREGTIHTIPLVVHMTGAVNWGWGLHSAWTSARKHEKVGKRNGKRMEIGKGNRNWKWKPEIGMASVGHRIFGCVANL